MQAEQYADQETVTETIIADEVSTESVAEMVVEEEMQLESVAETPVEETPLEPIVETLEIESIAVEIQTAEEIPANEESTSSELSTGTTVTPIVLHVVETFANPSELNESIVVVDENLDESLNVEEIASEENALETEADSEVQNEAVDSLMDEENQSESATVTEASEAVDKIESQPNDEGINTIVADTVTESSSEPAYDAFLKQSAEPAPKVEPVEEMSKVNLKVEPDSRNAHVWNELGNVYFNTGSLDEAITVYGKAIELDDCFAWPYSNLALAYVQREKYAEAILLYQRSIELFASDQDKAITWNRLGNVYRRLNDYDNAIVCYQRADELDPNNATRSLRSRFSLLGSLNMEQVSSLVV
jgi:tetratricopeptide (TPR) repeat protein